MQNKQDGSLDFAYFQRMGRIPGPRAFYCILPPVESEQYEDHEPRLPWIGMLHVENGVCWLLAVDGDGNTDDDSNAKALITDQATQLFGNREDAKAAYRVAVQVHIQKLLKEVEKWIARLGQS